MEFILKQLFQLSESKLDNALDTEPFAYYGLNPTESEGSPTLFPASRNQQDKVGVYLLMEFLVFEMFGFSIIQMCKIETIF